MESIRIAVVIPTLNEAESIEGVIRELPRPPVGQIIVADGGSHDGTQSLARAAGAIVVTPSQPGYGRACWEGAADRGDLVGQLIQPLLDGQQDFVIASRSRGKREPGSMNWHQLLAGWLAGLGIGLLYGFRYSDMCAFRAIRRDALDRLAMSEMTYGWNIEMQIKAAQKGLRILEIPMPYRCRSGGKSKVAGSLRGTVKAGSRIVATFLRMASVKV